MRRIMSFIFGMITGGILLYGAMHYHVIRAQDGYHLVPKSSARIAATYVDIREFTVADFAEHADIVEALILADKRDLMGNAASGALQNGLDRLLNRDGVR